MRRTIIAAAVALALAPAASVAQSLDSYSEPPAYLEAGIFSGLFGGHKNYCCRNNQDGRTKDIQASNKVSAGLKCMQHYAVRSISVSRGTCRR